MVTFRFIVDWTIATFPHMDANKQFALASRMFDKFNDDPEFWGNRDLWDLSNHVR